MSELYIGLMSGTSVDGIDAALVDFSDSQSKLIGSFYQEYTPDIRQLILSLCQSSSDEINRMGDLDVTLGKAFANAVKALLKNQGMAPSSIKAIGSHGQTIRHHPGRQFTLQIGDPNIIAAETGITTVADFRRRDIAHGGQGAPLVPAFHQHIFSHLENNRVVVNIGGIANMTLLPAEERNIVGFDTGPGNTLIDAWANLHIKEVHDKNGLWASQGNIHHELLNSLLSDPFFKLKPPKSTGREYFNLNWLAKYLTYPIELVDVQTTLTELTACSIIESIEKYISEGEILVCGGGYHNHFLMTRLTDRAKNFTIDSTEKYGVDPDWVEAMAFAWLAKQTLEQKTGNLPEVTGAKQKTFLGGVYYA